MIIYQTVRFAFQVLVWEIILYTYLYIYLFIYLFIYSFIHLCVQGLYMYVSLRVSTLLENSCWDNVETVWDIFCKYSWIARIWYNYIVPWWRYLYGYRLRHIIIHRLLLPTSLIGITIARLQTVLSLTVFTIHSFCRLSWPSTVSVGARLFTVDSRLSLSLLSPTTA
jgi:hypothetical protein